MRFLTHLAILGTILLACPMVNAEIKVDETLQKNYSYLNTAPVLKPQASTFFALEAPNQDQPSDEKAVSKKPQCMATNKQFVSCVR